MSSGGFDSRVWTGPEPEPARPAAKGARAAFAQAGGATALLPQRACIFVVALFFALIMAVVLLRSSPIDPWPLPRTTLGQLRETWIASGFAELLPVLHGTRTGNGIRACLTGLVLIASLGGIVSAWYARRSLALGFAAAEGPKRDTVFVTHHVSLFAPVFSFCILAGPVDDAGGSLTFLLVMGLLALFTARAITAVAERRFAGLGSRSREPSRWDVAGLCVSLAALSVTFLRLRAS